MTAPERFWTVLAAGVCLLFGSSCYDGPRVCQSASDCFAGEICTPENGKCIPCHEAPAYLREEQGCTWRGVTVDYDCDGTLPDPVDAAPGELPEPLAYWPFNREETEDARDRVGGGPAFERARGDGSRWIADGKAGWGFQIRNKQYLKAPHHEVFERSTGTIMFWFRLPQGELKASGKEAALFSKDALGTEGGGHLHIDLQSSNQAPFVIRARLQRSNDDETQHLTNPDKKPQLRRGRWHHVAVSFGSKGFALYADGRQVGIDRDRQHGLWSADGEIRNVQPVGLGVDRTGAKDRAFQSIGNYFTGRIDELAVFEQQFDPGPYAESCRDGP